MSFWGLTFSSSIVWLSSGAVLVLVALSNAFRISGLRPDLKENAYQSEKYAEGASHALLELNHLLEQTTSESLWGLFEVLDLLEEDAEHWDPRRFFRELIHDDRG